MLERTEVNKDQQREQHKQARRRRRTRGGGGGGGGSGDRLTDETTGQIVQWQTVCLRSTHLLCAAFRRMLRWHPAGKAKCGSRLISHPDTHITTRPLPECGLQHNAPEAAAWEEVAARQDGQPPEGWRATKPTKVLLSAAAEASSPQNMLMFLGHALAARHAAEGRANNHRLLPGT